MEAALQFATQARLRWFKSAYDGDPKCYADMIAAAGREKDAAQVTEAVQETCAALQTEQEQQLPDEVLAAAVLARARCSGSLDKVCAPDVSN